MMKWKEFQKLCTNRPEAGTSWIKSNITAYSNLLSASVMCEIIYSRSAVSMPQNGVSEAIMGETHMPIIGFRGHNRNRT
jgi:hypothetical protein